tara:strand:+ start:238 stop:492 length:255 start_codon:yes stop_codon:yes gene_type:complete
LTRFQTEEQTIGVDVGVEDEDVEEEDVDDEDVDVGAVVCPIAAHIIISHVKSFAKSCMFNIFENFKEIDNCSCNNFQNFSIPMP